MVSQVKHRHPSQIPLLMETMRYLIRECGVFLSVFSLVVAVAVDAFLKYAEIYICAWKLSHVNLRIR